MFILIGYDRDLLAFPSWSIIGDENRGEFNFFIQSLKLDDEGIFACEVSPYKEALALKKVAHLRTLVQPEHVQINDRQYSNQTKILQIRYDELIHQIDCQVNNAKPAAHIKWINESGQEFPATSRIFSHSNVFLYFIFSFTNNNNNIHRSSSFDNKYANTFSIIIIK